MQVNGVDVEWTTTPLHTLVGRRVIITLHDNSKREGFVYTVDHVTHNFFLVQPSEDAHQFHTIVVFGRVIQKVQVFEVKTQMDLTNNDFVYILHPELASKETLLARKIAVKNLLSKSFGMEVQEDNASLKLHSITIDPPYTPSSCSHQPNSNDSNPGIMLSRIQALLAKSIH